MTGKELYYISQAHFNGKLAGDGPFTERCHEWIESTTSTEKALLTHSCTAALEMTALLANIDIGDEVIMPSYTFVSTANAFVLRGAKPVFVDIRNDTLNINENLIENAISERTKAIVVVHYAGVSCEMDSILTIARKHNLLVIEDAAQGVMSNYKGRALGSIGDLGTYSFHETKNVISGEGGALLINRNDLVERAEIIREKGTNRTQFFRKQVDKYTWHDIGSSYLPGELIAAFLWAQLEEAKTITEYRMKVWDMYHSNIAPLENNGSLRRPMIPSECSHNAHMYYILLPDRETRNRTLDHLNKNGINAIFHYIPLHSSPAGQKYGITHTELAITNEIADRILRLPLWVGMTDSHVDQVTETLTHCLQ